MSRVNQAYCVQNEIPLSETTKFVVDNRGRTAPTEKAGIPLIATNCINNNNLYPVHENLRYVSQETYDNWFRSHPEPGDLLLTLKGSQNGAVCLVPDPVNFVIAQDMVALRVDEKVIDPLFLFAALRTDEIQAQIKNLDVSGVIPHLKKSDFDKLMLPYPERDTQHSIGQFYFYTSKKIDLLHRQNKTLEAMAETLFRQWFVEEREEDWEEIKITDLYEVRDGTHDSPKQKTIGYPLITSKHIQNGRIDIENAYLISEDDFNKVNERSRVDTGDILFSMIGTIGLIFYERAKEIRYAIKNIGLFKTSQNPEWAIYTYLWLKSPIGRQYIDEHKSGSTQEYVSLGSLRGITFQEPPETLLAEFNQMVSSWFSKIYSNQIQIQTLESLRDTLLPKLMSGEVRIAL